MISGRERATAVRGTGTGSASLALPPQLTGRRWTSMLTSRMTLADFGHEHAQVCRRLCAGLSAHSKSLNDPLGEAVARLNVKLLRRADESRESAYEVINGMVPTPGKLRLDTHSRYIFAHSLFRGGAQAGLGGYLCSLSVFTAGEELELLLLDALKKREFGFIHLTGGMQLDQIGETTGFHYFNVAAAAFRIMAAKAEGDEFSSLTISMQCEIVRSLIPLALDQCAKSDGKMSQLREYIKVIGSAG